MRFVDFLRSAVLLLVTAHRRESWGRPMEAIGRALAWIAALATDGTPRENGQIAEITTSLDLTTWPTGSRVIIRRERAHPGAQLTFTDHDGYRFQATLTAEIWLVDGGDIGTAGHGDDGVSLSAPGTG